MAYRLGGGRSIRLSYRGVSGATYGTARGGVGARWGRLTGMRVKAAIALAGLTVFTACGGGSGSEPAVSKGTSTSATSSSTTTAAASGAPDAGTSTAGTKKGGTAAAASASASTTSAGGGAKTTTGPTAATPAPGTASQSQAKGLIQGKVERDCGSPESGSGCNNQAAGVAGAVVELRSTSGAVLATATTDSQGGFQFTPAAGRYVIREKAHGVSQERDVAAGRTTFVTLVVPAR